LGFEGHCTVILLFITAAAIEGQIVLTCYGKISPENNRIVYSDNVEANAGDADSRWAASGPASEAKRKGREEKGTARDEGDGKGQ